MTRTALQQGLDDAGRKALRRAVRMEWATIAFLAVTIPVVGIVTGSSQAMRAAWIEDMLSLAPPIAFLVAVRVMSRAATPRYPYGYFRSVGVAHLVAGVALLTMGAFLLIESASTLVRGERPPIGSVEIFGQSVWLGWFMMAVMAATIPLPIWFGRVKMRLARQLHNKVLYADADMKQGRLDDGGRLDRRCRRHRAGTLVGGCRGCDLHLGQHPVGRGEEHEGLDHRPDGHPCHDLRRRGAASRHRPDPRSPVVARMGGRGAHRTRDQGQFFHVEAFVRPRKGRMPRLSQLERASAECRELDWKMHDVVIVPVQKFPETASARSGES